VAKRNQVGKGGKKGGSAALVIVLVVMLFLAFGAAIVFLNLFGLRDNQLSGILQNIPGIGGFVQTNNNNAARDPLANMTPAQLRAQARSLQTQLTNQQNTNDTLNETIADMREEIARLRELESRHLQFLSDKEEFDRLVAMGDPVEYFRFYEQISPGNAAALLREVAGIYSDYENLRLYISRIAAMDESAAAEMLSELSSYDMDLVVMIMNNLTAKRSGDILSEMDAEIAASIVRRMSPTR
jgi:flagellar motility protein MotE (MotC chaperone)